MPKRKLPKVIPIEELQKKDTKELLGYLKRLWRCEESFEISDRDTDPDLVDEETIYFKETQKWKEAYRKGKSILDTREHIKS